MLVIAVLVAALMMRSLFWVVSLSSMVVFASTVREEGLDLGVWGGFLATGDVQEAD